MAISNSVIQSIKAKLLYSGMKGDPGLTDYEKNAVVQLGFESYTALTTAVSNVASLLERMTAVEGALTDLEARVEALEAEITPEDDTEPVESGTQEGGTQEGGTQEGGTQEGGTQEGE